MFVFDPLDTPSSELQRWCSWLAEQWQHISRQDLGDRCCGLYLTLDQQVVFSVARITVFANLPLRMWSSSKSTSFYLLGFPDWELNPGPRVMKPMLYHWTIHTPLNIDCVTNVSLGKGIYCFFAWPIFGRKGGNICLMTKFFQEMWKYLSYDQFLAGNMKIFVLWPNNQVLRADRSHGSVFLNVAGVLAWITSKAQQNSYSFLFQQQQQPANIQCLETFQCHLKRIKASVLKCVLDSDLTKHNTQNQSKPKNSQQIKPKMPALPLQHKKTEPQNLSAHNTWFFGRKSKKNCCMTNFSQIRQKI